MRSRVIALIALSGVVIAACGGGASGPTPATPSASSSSSSGSSGGGSTGPDPVIDDSAPAPPPMALDCGDFSTCAIGSDGVTRCWGRNKDGEIGAAASTTERPKRGQVAGLGKATKIALASQLSCAILTDKKVKCWGSGKLGGRAIDNGQPTAVDGVDDADEIEGSGAIMCALGNKGVKCWGEDEKTIGTPPAGAFKQITTGFSHACALDDKGNVSCWGAGDWSAKGNYSKPGVTGALQVVTGDRHGCVIAKDKSVQCWGMNDAGQLGTKPDFTPHNKPTAVPGIKGATKLFAGEAANCAILADGGVKCWGSNGEGELGLGSRSSDERPQAVTGLSNVDHICFASSHACALTQDHKLLCWGSNSFGQLGDGTKERRDAPTPVAW